LKDYQENQLAVEKWRGKPIFILKQSEEMVGKLSDNSKKRLIKAGDGYYMVAVGLCTPSAVVSLVSVKRA